MTSTLLVGTANVLCTLDRARAGAAVDGVLAHEPDLVALQEWGLLRHGVLRRRGSVRLLPDLLPGPLRGRRRPEGARKGYRWLAPLAGGCAVGARADRLVLVDAGL